MPGARPGADAAVAPDRRRAPGREQQQRDGREREDGHGTRRTHLPQDACFDVPVAAPRGRAFHVEDRRRRAERDEHDRDQPPGAGRGEPRQQAEPAGERPDDRARRVRRVGQADVAPEACAAPAEQRDQHRKLVARR